MNRWQLLATLVAVMFGAHNLFVKRAAGRLPDAWGAFILEAVAALAILLFLGVQAAAGRMPAWPTDAGAVRLVACGGLLIGVGSVLYFWVFRLGAPLSAAVPWVLTGWVVVVVLLGFLLEKEMPGARHLAGLAFAGLAIWFLR
jgi:uncharacterized membrane protein